MTQPKGPVWQNPGGEFNPGGGSMQQMGGLVTSKRQ